MTAEAAKRSPMIPSEESPQSRDRGKRRREQKEKEREGVTGMAATTVWTVFEAAAAAICQRGVKRGRKRHRKRERERERQNKEAREVQDLAAIEKKGRSGRRSEREKALELEVRMDDHDHGWGRWPMRDDILGE